MTKFLIAALSIFMFAACNGSKAHASDAANSAKTVTRSLRYYNTINVNVPCDVYFTQGNASKVKIVGQPDDIRQLQISIDARGRMTISCKRSGDNFFRGCQFKDLKIYLTSSDLIALNMMGAGDFKTLSSLDTDNLNINMSGAGDIDFEKPVICDNFNFVLRGIGDAEFKSVEAKRANVELYGKGDIDVNLRKVARTDISLKGTGEVDVDLYRCGSLNCTLYGMGDIELEGSVRSFTQKKYGKGSIKCYKLKVAK